MEAIAGAQTLETKDKWDTTGRGSEKEVKAATVDIAKARSPRGRNLLFFGDEKQEPKELGIWGA